MDDKIVNLNTSGRNYMKTEQLCDYLQISRFTVYRLVNRREIPFVKVGKLTRFDKAEIDKWMAKRGVRPEAATFIS